MKMVVKCNHKLQADSPRFYKQILFARWISAYDSTNNTLKQISYG